MRSALAGRMLHIDGKNLGRIGDSSDTLLMSFLQYIRTRISSLHVERYRSIRDLTLTDLPELIVLHGPNGVGKSNIMRASSLLLGWAARLEPLPDVQHPLTFDLLTASRVLGIRPDDFTRGALPNMLISAEITIGHRAVKRTLYSDTLGTLHLTARLQDKGNNELAIWFEKADLNDVVSLFQKTEDPQSAAQINGLKNKISQEKTRLSEFYQKLTAVQAHEKSALEERVKSLSNAINEDTLRLQVLESKQSDDTLLIDRIRHLLIKHRLLHRSNADRHITREEAASAEVAQSITEINPFQTELFQSATSEDRGRRKAFNEFAGRISALDLFGDQGAVTLAPIHNKTFNEYQLLVTSEVAEDIPVGNLGTGQQQAIMLLADTHIADCPIVQIEEPEVHLHSKLMGRVARYLESSVKIEQGPLFDQLWISTHNHQFAIAAAYFDVHLEDGRTVVEKLPRSMAVSQFYEPSPLWDALRELVSNGVSMDKTIFRDESGNPITAGQILASIDGDRKLAEAYVRMATQAVVMSLKKANPPA